MLAALPSAANNLFLYMFRDSVDKMQELHNDNNNTDRPQVSLGT